MGSCARGRRWARLVGPPYDGPSRCQEPGLEASAPRSLRAGRQVGFCGRGRGAKPGETQVLPSPDPGSCPHSWDRRGGGWTPLHAVLSPRRPPMEPPRLTQVTKRVSEAGKAGKGVRWPGVELGEGLGLRGASPLCVQRPDAPRDLPPGRTDLTWPSVRFTSSSSSSASAPSLAQAAPPHVQRESLRLRPQLEPRGAPPALPALWGPGGSWLRATP